MKKDLPGLNAIVLVAFVVVAAVFSYVMLGAGFYTTQKSQESCAPVYSKQVAVLN